MVLAAAAVVLLTALAGAQTGSPFPKPPRMPPEMLTPPHNSPVLLRNPPVSFRMELDNARMRVMRFKMPPGTVWTLPVDASSPGVLLVAISDLELDVIGRGSVRQSLRLAAGETRWLVVVRPLVHNVVTKRGEFLLIQPKS